MAKDHGPSVRDDERYEAVREQGASKQKAARIANADPHEVGRRGGEASPYEEWTKRELYERAKELEVDGRSGMSKGELIEVLRRG
jgi:hypothetical protein